jgi:hypothetical protein
MEDLVGLFSRSRLPRQLRQCARRLGSRAFVDVAADSMPVRPPGRYPKLFVVGAPRSGTTWLQNMLRCHPRVIATRESQLCSQILSHLCRTDHRLRENWRALLEIYDRRAAHNPTVGVHRYVTRAVYRQILDAAWECVERNPTLSDKDAAGIVIRDVLDAFFVAHAGTDRDLLVEKTPIHVLYGEYLLETFPEARLVHVLRDGRDVCVSLQMRARAAGWTPLDRAAQIQFWRRCVQQGRQLSKAARFQARVIEIRYEDLKHNPIEQTGRLLRFAGLDDSARRIRRIVHRNDFRRYRRTGRGQHNRKGVVGDWRKHFSPGDAALFQQLAGDMLEQCGYA